MSTTTQERIIRPARNILGSLRLPGDKSISHRYAMLGAFAEGTSRFTNFSTGADCASTLACMQALGAKVRTLDDGRIEVNGVAGRVTPANHPLDCGNSGSTMRMISGLLAPQQGSFTLIGDASLSRRPMERIRKPLAEMGAHITLTDGHAPLTIEGAPLHAIDYTTPVPSAQVKTCVLLAGLQTAGTTTVRESLRTRDHSELALRAFGANLTRSIDSVSITGPQTLHAIEAAVPGDISSAAFFLCAAALFPDSGLVLDSLGLNPTRATLLDVLTSLGARIAVLHLEEKHAELVGTVQITTAADGLRSTEISGALAAQLIDELPVLAAIAPYTSGGIRIRDAKGAPRQGVRPHRSRREQSPRHGRRSQRVRRRPRRPRRPDAPRRNHRLRRRPPHRHGLQRRRSPRRGRNPDPGRRLRRHQLPRVLRSPRPRRRTLTKFRPWIAGDHPERTRPKQSPTQEVSS